MFLPCLSEEANSTLTIKNEMINEAQYRFPELMKVCSYVRKSGNKNCIVLKSSKRKDDSETLMVHDLRMTSSIDDYGLVMMPVSSLTKNTNSLVYEVSWEVLNSSLINIREQLRRSLFGTFYIPIMKVKDVSDDDVLEEYTEILKNVNDVVLIINDDDCEFEITVKSNDVGASLGNSLGTEKTDEKFQVSSAGSYNPNASLIAGDFETIPVCNPKEKK